MVNEIFYKSKLDNQLCISHFKINDTLQPPIFIYYELSNFYMNHRDYVRSRSFAQLRNANDTSNYSKCDGAKTVGEIFDFEKSRYKSLGGNDLNENSTANPCGLGAKSMFNGMIKNKDRQICFL